MRPLDTGPVTWRKSSYSTDQSNCVEVALSRPSVGVRDSKKPEAGQLAIPARAWRGFLHALS
ncbi:MAG: DUF397 domain-containing protein [Sciscionella sp.]